MDAIENILATGQKILTGDMRNPYCVLLDELNGLD